MTLSPELAAVQAEVEGYAREYGLDFYPVIFEMLDYKQMNEVAAYGGFPQRYPHWRFGMEYLRTAKSYAYGLHRIYEMVINNDPAYAYLLVSNKPVHQKMVMAHVYGHVDFMKNNMWFAHTNRKMMDRMADHATQVRRIIDKQGYGKAERFLDLCLSVNNLIDIHAPGIVRHKDEECEECGGGCASCRHAAVRRLPAKDYMDGYINPPEFIEAQHQKKREEKHRKKHFPEQPERDAMAFLLEHAPLERWQQALLAIVRDEAYYFAPVGQTKIMNEGWAVYWHSKIMTERAMLPDEVIDYAEHNAGIMGVRPGHLNPYKLGVELFRDIEERWDKGRFGKDWEECDDLKARKEWDTGAGLGLEKVFEVRRLYNDVGFIDEFLTPQFAREHKLFTYEYDEKTGYYVIDEREFQAIKRKLLFHLTNFGQPIVEVVDGNFENRGELLLLHRHEGIDLKQDWAHDTLANIQALWQRPVHIDTVVEEKPKRLSFDGQGHSEKTLSSIGTSRNYEGARGLTVRVNVDTSAFLEACRKAALRLQGMDL